MKKEEMKIGLALSGGGMRAAIYHLGVLKCLAEEQLLANIQHISSVSGASICIGLIFGANQTVWPTDEEFLKKVLPDIKHKITNIDVQWSSFIHLLFKPYYWDKKVNLLSNVMEKKWNLSCCLQDIAKHPTWTINTTAFETGKNFKISNKRMGGGNSCVMNPSLRLSHALGASAGFPVFIGPYKLKTQDFHWVDRTGVITVKPKDRILHLWDGGVFDNMGLDPLFHRKAEDHLAEDINYLIVSVATGNIEHMTRRCSFSIGNLKRMLDISMDQVESIKSNAFFDEIRKNHNGIYLKIGTEVKDILRTCSFSYEEKMDWINSSMKRSDVMFVKNYKTTLERVKPINYDKILQHGYETTKIMLHCYGHIN